ncbi:MAG: biotin--[acetyl-CoA-carboxylase] ligase [Clostridia bacterium]|nr:biotin--[acetyl-CoA-carboxylase] ligase [Clostridia bacterium]MBP3708490.1 biotin--[acetyl-CoA-carboxylase] ligase [Clostridia bacterium]
MQLENLDTNIIGKTFVYYDKIDSTQKEIWRLIDNKKIKNGQLVMAGIQTDGIGTHGRKWHTDENRNIAFSFYVEVNSKLKNIEGITIDLARIIVEIFKTEYHINLQIKEPNDIMCNNKKLGGILTEAKTCRGIVKYLVIGIGINTNKTSFPESIKNIATSVKKEFNISVDEMEFIKYFCKRIEQEIIKRSEKK